jgi:hypothetical protein
MKAAVLTPPQQGAVGKPAENDRFGAGLRSLRHVISRSRLVIPGRRKAASPESILRSAGVMDSGLAA